MSEIIENFIERLIQLEREKIEAYPYEQYDCELAFAQKCYHNTDFLNKDLAHMWKNIFDKPNFELHHPIYNHILTRAIMSWQPSQISLRSLTLFVDENNQYPWVLLVTYEQASAFITAEKFFLNRRYMSNNEHDRWLRWVIPQDCKKMVQERKLCSKNVYFRESPYCLNMQSERPHHYFVDSLFWYRYLKLTNEVWSTPLFFVANFIKICKDPNAIPIPFHLGLNEESLTFVADESIENFNTLVESQDKLDKFGKEYITPKEINNLLSCL